MKTEPEFPDLSDTKTNLEDLKSLGWFIERNGHQTYFRHRKTQQVRSIPHWAMQLVHREVLRGQEETRKAVRDAIMFG